MKCNFVDVDLDTITSSPSRGTWIEMDIRKPGRSIAMVVPLTGDVD